MKKTGLLCCLLLVMLTACNNHSYESDKKNEEIASEELKNNKAQESQKVQDIKDKDVEETESEVVQEEISENESVMDFAKDFINEFNGSIANDEAAELDQYIENDNLLTFAYKMIELTQKQEKLGMNLVVYGEDNEFGEIELSEISTGVYYLNVPFNCNGSGMTCQLLIQLIDSNWNILDFYFGNQDGVDTLATGHPSEREVKNPGLWEDTDWVTGVNERLLEHEEKIDSMLSQSE